MELIALFVPFLFLKVVVKVNHPHPIRVTSLFLFHNEARNRDAASEPVPAFHPKEEQRVGGGELGYGSVGGGNLVLRIGSEAPDSSAGRVRSQSPPHLQVIILINALYCYLILLIPFLLP